MPIKQLTKAEEQIMHILWNIKRGFIHDILEELPSPKPAYTTVSTIVRKLIRKGFVDFKAYGKTHEYYPFIEKGIYSQFSLNKFIKGYFDGSFGDMVSFFAKENDLSVQEVIYYCLIKYQTLLLPWVYKELSISQ